MDLQRSRATEASVWHSLIKGALLLTVLVLASIILHLWSEFKWMHSFVIIVVCSHAVAIPVWAVWETRLTRLSRSELARLRWSSVAHITGGIGEAVAGTLGLAVLLIAVDTPVLTLWGLALWLASTICLVRMRTARPRVLELGLLYAGGLYRWAEVKNWMWRLDQQLVLRLHGDRWTRREVVLAIPGEARDLVHDILTHKVGAPERESTAAVQNQVVMGP